MRRKCIILKVMKTLKVIVERICHDEGGVGKSWTVWERMWVVKEDEEWKVIMGLLKVKWEHKVNITLSLKTELV